MNPQFLSLNNVSLSYFGTEFGINNIDICLDEGNKLIVYGREGSGKTLLLRAIAGLEEPIFGDILLDGKNLKDVDVKDRDIGFSFDFSSLKLGKSVSEILEYPMRLRGYAQDEIERAVKLAADRFALDKDACIVNLDDFDKAKVLLARLFAIERKLYIVDDVWKDLEYDRQREIVELLSKVAAGKSVIIATQEIEFVNALGGVVAILCKGESTIAKPLDSHRLRPVNMEAAILCGYAIYLAILQTSESGYVAMIGEVEYQVPPPIADVYVGKQECFALSDNGVVAYYDKDCERIISKDR